MTVSTFYVRSHFKEGDAVVESVKRLISDRAPVDRFVLQLQTTTQSLSKGENPSTRFNTAVTSIKNDEHEAVLGKDALHDDLILVLKQYQEQPGLLDSHLEVIVHLLLKALSQLLPRLRQLRIQQESNLVVMVCPSTVEESTYLTTAATEADRKKSCTLETPCHRLGSDDDKENVIRSIWYIASILYTICIVRRSKTAVSVFLTDVQLLEPVLEAIEDLIGIPPVLFPPCNSSCTPNSATPYVLSDAYYDVLTARVDAASTPPAWLMRHADPTHWKFLYGLLMWLSLLILAPFEFNDFGSQRFFAQDDKDLHSVVIVERSIPERVVVVVQECLRYPNAIQLATALLISKLMCRPDVYSTSVPAQFLNWCKIPFELAKSTPLGVLSHSCNSQESVRRLGCLRSLKSVLKVVGLPSLKCVLPPMTDLLLKTIVASVDLTSNSTSSLLKKLHTAVIGRLALRYLPSQLATWRCLRDVKQLQFLHNGVGLDQNVSSMTSIDAPVHETSLSEDVSQWMETILDLLLQQLECQTITVRWAAAKAIGRMTQHLPFEFGDQLVESILQLAETTQNENCVHGASMTLAELTRRGCLLPHRLDRLIPVLCKASQYETNGVNRLGPAVRDAACFICWAIARAYDSVTLHPYVQPLTEALLTVALYDRNVNCRRAASAAIQEHVGRQGLFPHGIPIVTIADYFNVATVRRSYLCAAPKIAEFVEYRQLLLSCLIKTKLAHSERSIREFAAKSLELIACHCSISELVEAMAELQARLLSSMGVGERHGALLGISALINCLSNRTIEPGAIEDSCLTELRNIIPQLEKARQYRGRGGELIREACCRLISALANATSWIPFKVNTTQRYYQSTVEGLRNFAERVQLAATEGLYFLALKRASNEQLVGWADDFLTGLVKPSENVAARRGLIVGLGILPWTRATINKAFEVLNFFCNEATTRAPNGLRELNDPQARQSAVIALPFVLMHLRNAVHSQSGREDVKLIGRDDVGDRRAELNTSAMLSGAFTGSSGGNKLDTLQRGIDEVCRCLEVASLDDQFDRRGDVGSWVRESAIEAIAYLLETLPATVTPSSSSSASTPYWYDPIPQVKNSSSIIVDALSTVPSVLSHPHCHCKEHSKEYEGISLSLLQVSKLFSCILRQCADKFDRTRGRGTFLCYRLLNHALLAQTSTSQWDCLLDPAISPVRNKKHPDAVHPQTMRPEWIFRRAYYSYSYEITCGHVTRPSLEDLEVYERQRNARDGVPFYYPSIRSLPHLSELTDIFNSVIDSDLGACPISDKGLGTQSCLAPPYPIHMVTQLESSNSSGNPCQMGAAGDAGTMRATGVEDANQSNDDLLADDESTDSLVDQDLNMKEDSTTMGGFVSWETYHYAVQRFQKAGITLKILQCTRSECVFPRLVKLLEYPPYRHPILAGLVNAIGVALGFVCHSASSALLSLLLSSRHAEHRSLTTAMTGPQSEQPKTPQSWELDEASGASNILSPLEIWVTETLTTVGVAAKASKKCPIIKPLAVSPVSSMPSGSHPVLEFYGSVGFASVLRTFAVLFQNGLGAMTKVHVLFPSIRKIMSTSTEFTILRAALDLCCSIVTYPDRTSSDVFLVTRAEMQRMRHDALLSAVDALGHQFPVIRQHACEQLFARLIALSEEQLQFLLGHPVQAPISNVFDVLLDTEWSLLVEGELQDAVERIAEGFQLCSE